MTLEEFITFANEQARKAKIKEDREEAARKRRLENQRFKGFYRDFVDKEGDHYIAVKNNQIVERCDTEAQAYRIVHSDNYIDEDYRV